MRWANNAGSGSKGSFLALHIQQFHSYRGEPAHFVAFDQLANYPFKGCQYMDFEARKLWSEISMHGWSTIRTDEREDLLDIAKKFGSPISSRAGGNLVDLLRPIPPAAAKRRSMSAVYGMGAFPFHTDSAHFRIPPRLTLLRLAPGSVTERPTLLHDFRALRLCAEDLACLRHDVWYVNGGKGRFLTSILSRTDYSPFGLVRLDPCCMIPAHPSFKKSADVVEQACDEALPIEIDWEPGVTVILDNWRMLHARGPQPKDSEVRILERVMIRA
jgi:hypothetical protein